MLRKISRLTFINLKIAGILVFTVLIIACKKGNNSENQQTPLSYHAISPSLYPYLFDTSSYWVYKNTISAAIDSIIVLAAGMDTGIIPPGGAGQGPQGYLAYYNIVYMSVPNNQEYYEQSFSNVVSRNQTSGDFVFISTKTIGDSVDNAEIMNVFDSMTVENATYRSVVEMRINKDYYITNNYRFYYVDSIGIIKKETINNDTVSDTWDLLRFKTKLHAYH